jgi:Lar family restriction alleviation protein
MSERNEAAPEPVASNGLLPCPFCGEEAEIERYGDRRMSTIYACTGCGCRLETEEERDHGRWWNERHPSAGADGLLHDSIHEPSKRMRFGGTVYVREDLVIPRARVEALMIAAWKESRTGKTGWLKSNARVALHSMIGENDE